MEVKELRIGNLVSRLGYDFNEGGKFLDGTKEEIIVDIEILQDIIDQPEHYEPISITEECLLKYGYVLENEFWKVYYPKEYKIEDLGCQNNSYVFRLYGYCNEIHVYDFYLDPMQAYKPRLILIAKVKYAH